MASQGRVPRGTWRRRAVPFSFTATHDAAIRSLCFLMHTNDRVHRTGARVTSTNPRSTTAKSQGLGRVLPSLEDKVMRFPDRERHQLFLEPEGWTSRRFT